MRTYATNSLMTLKLIGTECSCLALVRIVGEHIHVLRITCCFTNCLELEEGYSDGGGGGGGAFVHIIMHV